VIDQTVLPDQAEAIKRSILDRNERMGTAREALLNAIDEHPEEMRTFRSAFEAQTPEQMAIGKLVARLASTPTESFEDGAERPRGFAEHLKAVYDVFTEWESEVGTELQLYPTNQERGLMLFQALLAMQMSDFRSLVKWFVRATNRR